MRTTIPIIMEKYENEKKTQAEIKKRITAPAMNNDKETTELINKHKELIDNIKWCENENQNYTFLSNLEEIAYYPNAPPVICKKKTNNSICSLKKSTTKQDRWDKYLEYFEH
tara:strand:+ start:697 stop:1032 length:336 start_codon:yes stop_codon:yes gene_type:complete